MPPAIATTELGAPGGGPAEVPIDRVEAELNRRLKAAAADIHAPVRRARMSNLIIFCDCPDQADRAEAEVPEIVAIHPARVLLVLAEPAAAVGGVRASVLVRRVDHRPDLVSEQVTLRAGGRSTEELPFAVRGLLIGDLPTNLWWACPSPPALAGPILGELAERAEQVIYDSLGWADPSRGVAATSSWLDRFERGPGQGRWRVASDLAWRRLKSWRRLISQGLDPASAPGFLPAISEVLIEHGPHAVTQAWQLASWMASRLGWAYQASKVKPDVEIAFQFRGPRNPITLRIDRLPDGPAEIHRVRVSRGFEGKDGSLEFAAEPSGRLAIQPQGVDIQARTMAVPGRRIAELIGRQLSDREADPVFRESMKVAQRLAQHVV